MDAIPVYGPTGQKVDTVDLNEGIFAATVDERLVHKAVVMQRLQAGRVLLRRKAEGKFVDRVGSPGSRSILGGLVQVLRVPLSGGMVERFLGLSQDRMAIICLERCTGLL